MHVSGLFIHPVKSLAGVSVSNVSVDSLGVVGDRRFMVVDSQGRFITQRTVPRMALIQTELSCDLLSLSAPGVGKILVGRESDATAPLRTVSIWGSEALQAEDCGDVPAAWLEMFLGFTCRLVRAGERMHRRMNNAARSTPDDEIAFTDAHPLLVISEASLENLNARLLASGEVPVPMNRFRPNVVIAQCAPFAEDTWSHIRIGEVLLRAAGPCKRCVVTTTDQTTAERGKEPLRTLARFRRDVADPSQVNFGQNFCHETKTGSFMVGANLDVLSQAQV
jgi:uncharacterized protein YcbX